MYAYSTLWTIFQCCQTFFVRIVALGTDSSSYKTVLQMLQDSRKQQLIVDQKFQPINPICPSSNQMESGDFKYCKHLLIFEFYTNVG